MTRFVAALLAALVALAPLAACQTTSENTAMAAASSADVDCVDPAVVQATAQAQAAQPTVTEAVAASWPPPPGAPRGPRWPARSGRPWAGRS